MCGKGGLTCWLLPRCQQRRNFPFFYLLVGVVVACDLLPPFHQWARFHMAEGVQHIFLIDQDTARLASLAATLLTVTFSAAALQPGN